VIASALVQTEPRHEGLAHTLSSPADPPSMTSAPESPDFNRPLHVGLDVRPWEMSGLGTYIQELLRGSAQLELPIDWTLIGPVSLRERLPAGLRLARWIELDRPLYRPSATLAYPRLPALDVFHYPHYNLPLWRARRAVVTVFDLFHLHYGSWNKALYQAFFLRRLRWGRCAVLTACDKTARELAEEGGIAPDRIHCVPLGPGRRPAPHSQPSAPPKLLNGQRLRPPWLLAVGIDQPHKNFDFLLSSLGLYFQRRPDAPPLVWAGLREEACRRRLKTIPASIRDRIVFEPYVDAGRLEELYAGADALLFPSLDEGFGLPPLEAMARAVPVICARCEPMTTLLGGAPLYFEPGESPSLWRTIDRLLDVPGIRQEAVRRGLRQVAQYDWDRCAYQTFSVYARVAGREDLTARMEKADPAAVAAPAVATDT
jgi:alpha-1,3-rhamnosyl/mannosyltransferase